MQLRIVVFALVLLVVSASIEPKPDLSFNIDDGSTYCNIPNNICSLLDSYIPIPERPELMLNLLQVSNYRVTEPWTVLQLLNIEEEKELDVIQTPYRLSQAQFIMLDQNLPNNKNRAVILSFDDEYFTPSVLDYRLEVYGDDNITLNYVYRTTLQFQASFYYTVETSDEKVYMIVEIENGAGVSRWQLYYILLTPGNVSFVETKTVLKVFQNNLDSIDMFAGAFNNDFDHLQVTVGCTPYVPNKYQIVQNSLCTFNLSLSTISGALIAEQLTNNSFSYPIYYPQNYHSGMYINSTYSGSKLPLVLVNTNYNQWSNKTVPASQTYQYQQARNPTYSILQSLEDSCTYIVSKSNSTQDIGLVGQFSYDNGIHLLASLDLNEATLGTTSVRLDAVRLYGSYLYVYFQEEGLDLVLNRYAVDCSN